MGMFDFIGSLKNKAKAQENQPAKNESDSEPFDEMSLKTGGAEK